MPALPNNYVDASFHHSSFYDDGKPCPVCKTTVKRTKDQTCKLCYDNGETIQQRRQREAEQIAYHKAYNANIPETLEEAVRRGFEHYGMFDCRGIWRRPSWHKAPRRVVDDACGLCFQLNQQRAIQMSNERAELEAKRLAQMAPEQIAKEQEDKRIAEAARKAAEQAADAERKRIDREKAKADPVKQAAEREKARERKRKQRARQSEDA
jgi:hypothetical protein